MTQKLVFASSNQGKLREVRMLLQNLSFEVVGLKDLVFLKPMPEETGATYEENALIKARFVAKESNLPTIADDSGIEIDALPQEFGLHSARIYAGTTEERMQFLLDKMRGVQNRSARFICVIAFVDPVHGIEKTFRGVMEGSIAEEMRGDDGFDYDFVFIAKGQTKTNAELGVIWKNARSHRALAVQQFSDYIQQNKKSF